MDRKTGTGQDGSGRTQERDRTLEEALAKPGLREFLALYGSEQDRRLVGPHRTTIKSKE